MDTCVHVAFNGRGTIACTALLTAVLRLRVRVRVLTAECNQCMATSKRMAASRDGENVNEDGNAAYFKLCILVYSKMKSVHVVSH